MTRERISLDLNMSDVASKRRLMAALSPLQGLYEVKLNPIRPTRSSRANRYWHGVVVTAFRGFMAAQGQEFTHDQCHEYLRDRFIPREPVFNPATGEVMGEMPASSAVLSGPDFFEFVERVRIWMETDLNCPTPDPGEYGIDTKKRTVTA